MTRTRIIDLMPFVVAFSLGFCTVLSSAGCAEERARAAGEVVDPPLKTDEGDKTKELTNALEKALEASAKPTAMAAEPKSEPIETTVDREVSAPKSEPVKPVYEASFTQNEGIYLQRLKTASEIENREPVMETSSFEVGAERIYVFMDVRNDTDEEQKLIVNFIGPDERVRGGIEMEVPPSVPRWRTWAYTRKIKVDGQWLAEVRLADGTLLGSVPFEVY